MKAENLGRLFEIFVADFGFWKSKVKISWFN